MTLKLEVNAELALRLKRTAAQRGLDTEECALQLLQEGLDSPAATAGVPLTADPLMTMVGVDDFEPTSVDEVVYR